MDEALGSAEQENDRLVPHDAHMSPDVTTKGAKNEVKIRPSTLPTVLQGVTNGLLHFLSHASNETLGACLVGLGATTYLVLGRIGLVIIGVAGGVVLHATWQGTRFDDRDEETNRAEQDRQREAGVEVVRRVLEWRWQRGQDEEKLDDVKVYANQSLDFSSFEPDTALALDTFTNAVIKDYVRYWYDPTLPGEESFPAACKRTFTAFALSLTNHLRRKRPADAFLDFLTNASSIIIVFLNELSAALNASPNSSAEDAIFAYLRLKPDSSLSYMLDRDSQRRKLAEAAEDILQAYLDPKAYNCPPMHVFLKQVLSHLVLGYTLDICSKPEWIDDWIVYGLEESKTTKEVMDIVDAGVGGGTKKSGAHGEAPIEDNVFAAPVPTGTKEAAHSSGRPTTQDPRQMSRGEESMDEAMREARRLTQLMQEEDERRAKHEQETRLAVARSSSEDLSDSATYDGAPTPTSSQSDKERSTEEAAAWGRDSSSLAESDVARIDERPVTPTSTKQQFTSFDQIMPSQQPAAVADSPKEIQREPLQLTLHNASINILDDSAPGERALIKTKPSTDYLIQIEPSSKQFSGWMIARKYTDFEMLHEVLRRIGVITGVRTFTVAHEDLPQWRTNTKAGLRAELERYLTDAVHFQPLAESEGMKRFLEKDQGQQSRSSGAVNKAFGWPTPDAFGKFGGDMMNVLTKAPRQMAGGGKAVIGGVAGLVGGVGGKRPPGSSTSNLARKSTTGSVTGGPIDGFKATPSSSQPFATEAYFASVDASRPSQESVQSISKPSLDQQSNSAVQSTVEVRQEPRVWPLYPDRELMKPADSEMQEANFSSIILQTKAPAPVDEVSAPISLPPLPSEIPDDFDTSGQMSRASFETYGSSSHDLRASIMTEDEVPPPTPPRPAMASGQPKRVSAPAEPINEREASVATELMFAVITELYTLSSAWQIRRTLLTAAKTYLLRPGNPQLLSIRKLLQESLLDSNLNDSGVAAHIHKLRYNSLPTVEEMGAWKTEYPEKTAEQREALRVKARKLLVTKGMPQALTSIMGAAASGEALGKVFDCLQVEEVSRGLVFGLLLQALRVVTD